MIRPKVSWLMPVYNAGRFLTRAMDSILAQTMQDFEVIIVVEKGCQDNTEDICDKYSKNDSRIIIIKNRQKLGIAKSLNIGMSKAKGEYIARMDADDYSYPQRLEKQCDYMDAHPEIGILCTNRRILSCGYNPYQSDHPTNPEEISARLLFGFCLNHPSMMLRGDLFRDRGWQYSPDREAEDFELCARLVRYTKIGCLDEVLLDYYEHGDNAIYSKFAAVRKASADISREALHARLGLDNLEEYEDIYFGWRELDVPHTGYTEYLGKAFDLLKKIYMANKKEKVIEEDVFRDEINRQWKMCLDISGLGFLIDEFDFVELINQEDISEYLDQLSNIFSRIFSCESEIGVWGTGNNTKEILETLQSDYPFNLRVFIDSNPDKVGKDFLGINIVSPNQLNRLDFVAIGSSKYRREIYKELTEKRGVSKYKIFNLPSKEILLMMKKYNKNIADSKKIQGYIFLAPDYGNLGDHAIIEAEKFFLQEMGMCVHEIPADKFHEFAFLIQCTSRSDYPIFITGGGFFGSLWYEHYRKAEEVIALHPNNPIIVFPQTLYWDEKMDQEKIKKSQEILASHKKLVLCARDFVSYMMMKKYYKNNKIILVPDMALSMQWGEYFTNIERDDKAIICLKNDKESILDEVDKRKIYDKVKHHYGSVSYCNTDKGLEIDEENRKFYLKQILEEFRHCSLVVTDRLHGMIFAAITETPCIALDNCNHKLRYTYEWLRDIPYIKFTRDIDNINCIIQEIGKENVTCSFHFDREAYFGELRNIIKSFIASV